MSADQRQSSPPSLRGAVRRGGSGWSWAVIGASGRIYAAGQEGNHTMALGEADRATGALRGAWMYARQDVRQEMWS